MLFLDALKSALFGVFRYSGRADRLEQWTFASFTALLAGAVFALDVVKIAVPPLGVLGIALLAVWIILAHVALFVRRLHDNDRSGAWMLPLFVALSIAFVGHLGMEGRVPFAETFFAEYGWIVMRAGLSGCSISGSYLLWFFANEGTRATNRFGPPPY